MRARGGGDGEAQSWSGPPLVSTSGDYGPGMSLPSTIATTFAEMRELFVMEWALERLVFTHADGRQAQVTRQDFGL